MARRARIPGALLALLVLAAVFLAPHADSAPALTSPNWSGYAVLSRDFTMPVSFTSVTGTWTQPAAKCAAGDDYSQIAIWVGIGGYDADQLEQVGTQIACNGADPPSYTAWYELPPADPVALSLVVSPGDVLTASVNVSGKHVIMQLINRRRGKRVTEKATVKELDVSSAEWIGEATTPCRASACAELPLANFGSLEFSRIATIGNGHAGTLTDSLWQAIPLQIVPKARRSGTRTAVAGVPPSTAGTSPPLLLAGDGRAFSLRWLAKAASAG